MDSLFDNPGEQAFQRFHREHPQVFELFKGYAHEAKRSGLSHYSARAIIHLIRWHHHIERGDREFTINDHVSPYYGRYLAAQDPEFDGFFEKRRLKSA